ncbi:uncharacterized protein PpBr36_09555 [Pyricularia pennisetigena]|uniref:uncharacterized protein n=1 Tax=Pyricularia pennisetigena TaxID=1578925 RepID=UPI0011517EF9|nr:uncharacterized protein PpBr36_09555 [Pyricularia pennisetigena]TLS21617.1 hypothetical protein PpBr36_09555 [Pyricularia pennisetigena]
MQSSYRITAAISISFPKAEEEVLQLWRDVDAFQTQLRLTQEGPRFTFYDGPPFGLPHYGHLLASTIKDIIPRYWSMNGHHVVRRFGWDTHGLPIEYEIDKKLGISGRDAVMQMGIEKYNAECKAIVMKYSGEWRRFIERLGRWIDFDNDYKVVIVAFMSMDVTFMESCWWVFKQLYDKDQVYRAYQIMPFSTALCTPLSQMEAKQNEKSTLDPAVVVSFPLVNRPEHESTSLLIYTTTPWTLPSNMLIAVNPSFEYAKILDEKSGMYFIILESLLSSLYKDLKKAKYKVVAKIPGKDMIGWKYEPLFRYFANDFSDCFEVIGADYVEAGEGTGLVHQAQAFGQEDYDAAIAAGFFGPGRLPPALLTTRVVSRMRSPNMSDSMSRKAVSSWFIKVTNDTDAMLQNLDKTTWVPQFVKDKRFANWVANAHDWNVSRNRYWGTPIPLWVSEDYEEIVCVGSIEELKRLSGYEGPLDDLHRDKVDGITIPSSKGKGTLRRIDEIFDCWFESGSMPYASNHYPFQDKDKFEQSGFPADFIAEGLDQTGGWFYTLSVLGNKLFGTSRFRNCIVNGLVLAEDGKKMSKSQKLPRPDGVVRAEPLRFKEAGVKDIVSRVLLPLWNSYRFFSEQAALFNKTEGTSFVADSGFFSAGNLNVMDRWILADCQSLLRFMEEEMRSYRLYTVVPRLLQVIDNLTNWYIRFNRKRLKGAAGLGVEDTRTALNTLFQVLFTVVRAMAPFTPFITEHIYGEELFDPVIERQIAAMQKVIQLARAARERRSISLKTPLLSLVVIADAQFIADVDALKGYVADELNVREVILTGDEEKYNQHSPGSTKLRQYQKDKKITVGGIELDENDLTTVRVLAKDDAGPKADEGPQSEPSFDQDVVVLLDAASHPELADEGLARDIVNRVQRLRKKAGLVPTDDVRMQYNVVENPDGTDVEGLMRNRDAMFMGALRGHLEPTPADTAGSDAIIEEDHALGNLVLRFRLVALEERC